MSPHADRAATAGAGDAVARRGMRALGIGELLWDLLPTGARLGGAPFNVVAHLRRLGFNASYVTAVGYDALGEQARDEARRLGVDASLIRAVDLPTGVVRVELDADGVPIYEIVSPAAYEAVALSDLQSVEGAPDVLVFGTLAQRFPSVLAATTHLTGGSPDSVRLYDVNLRRGCWDPSLVRELIALATVVKFNEAEAKTIGRALELPGATLEAFTRALAARHGLRAVCVTRGADGAALFLEDVFCQAPAKPVVVADTVGAGDAFAAGLAASIAWRWPIEAVLELSTRLAALVASREGAIPDWDVSELGRLPGGLTD